MEELKPCPFCGGEASIRLYYNGRYGVQCDVCGVRGVVKDCKEEAIKAWNARHERTVKLKDNGHCPDCRKLVGTGERYCAWCGAKVER